MRHRRVFALPRQRIHARPDTRIRLVVHRQLTARCARLGGSLLRVRRHAQNAWQATTVQRQAPCHHPATRAITRLTVHSRVHRVRAARHQA